MADQEFDLVVIGAGPGGYVAALRAAQLGMRTACVEKEEQLGGTCLRVGCIPSKALLESSERYEEARLHLAEHGVRTAGVELDLAALLARKDRVVATLAKGIAGLLEKARIVRFNGRGRLEGPGQVVVDGPDGTSLPLRARHILLATGSEVAGLAGVEVDGDRIAGSTEALSYPEVPSRLVVIGAGVIGLELGSVWRRLGARVTVLEYLDRILSGVDGETAGAALRIFRRQGLEVHLGVRVSAARRAGGSCVVERVGAEAIECDRVLVAVGRRPYTAGLGLETVAIEPDRSGRLRVDERFQTTARGVCAIGDLIAGPMLAHKAEEEGIACVEYLATGHGHVNYDAIPTVVYTHPEIAAVGRTEEDLREAGVAYRKGVFPFVANGRARTLAQTDGQVKILADATTDRLLGVHVLGPRAGDVIAEVAVAVEFGAGAEDLARSVHAHPTLAEAVKEAALAVEGRAIHL